MVAIIPIPWKVVDPSSVKFYGLHCQLCIGQIHDFVFVKLFLARQLHLIQISDPPYMYVLQNTRLSTKCIEPTNDEPVLPVQYVPAENLDSNAVLSVNIVMDHVQTNLRYQWTK